MKIHAATEPGSTKPNEDHFAVGTNLAVVIDGATARTDTGCEHGVPWYVTQLGSVIQATLSPDMSVPRAVTIAIAHVADLHVGTCDLDHPGTPSASVVVVRKRAGLLDWLVLGDVTLVLDHGDEPEVRTDPHEHVAAKERAEADLFPIGDPRKDAAMIRMKQVELAHRNVDGGFWVAATDPTVVEHALVGSTAIENLRRVALMTDGAARLVDTFGDDTWQGVLDSDPADVIRRVRKFEENDAAGIQWPRNKKSDDATILSCSFES